MRKKIIECYNGPVTVSDFCSVETPRKIEISIGIQKRGKCRYAALTLRQAADLIMSLQEALRERLPVDPGPQPELMTKPLGNLGQTVVH